MSNLHRHAFVLVALLSGCAQDSSWVDDRADVGVPEPPQVEELGFKGSEATFDVMTWNLERFPKKGDDTIAMAAQAIAMLAADVVAVQEIVDTDSLQSLAHAMPGWEAIAANDYDANEANLRYNPPVGILFDTSVVVVHDHYLLYEGLSLPFPRPPLVLELTWRDVPLVIVNVHLKALGDDFIDTGNSSDEEVRRRDACDLLDRYLRENLDDRRVIVLGDFNDRLEEPRATNVFWSFLERPDRYVFADMPLAVEHDELDISYPRYRSHIDHILLTNELYVAYLRGSTIIRAAALERTLPGGWSTYRSTLSDHRPVFLSLDLAPR